ncbi:unnamed protein product [Photorhabdus laumondii subsp. laumondii TTO1]|uniref:Photorhabdus luminescens subsp. laumondii TTO1 complete genome segment 6/17 n=1 Tax=Photorhabdus laumondii subsp. laumondii (strain DSM 15139 / CIP 105565 / TT01) TaxID=243265 RepID=Q7N635_PHOLL|nr:unnamed protein product [Photorhabdus laumondii subsp. laumondii TTO1]
MVAIPQAGFLWVTDPLMGCLAADFPLEKDR